MVGNQHRNSTRKDGARGHHEHPRSHHMTYLDNAEVHSANPLRDFQANQVNTTRLDHHSAVMRENQLARQTT